ncbi:hypothetical protein LEM8419_02654 [Neolewinella maritima]|uniref:DUF4239 domain-containing protein n=1 Tax=Neolewinella maritima TaxID=1383882 RepID=A0ABM9B324_9BACT|nr:hypothetical protein [Neolewinella maritima]CAH1001748.1 hypothetical protein LEM8419_02654 [Neolewinella maritima]
MYNLNSVLIVAILFALILLADLLGLKMGQRVQHKSDSDVKSQTSAIQGGIIGMLALILGFTFNMSIQRYDSRAGAEVEEANAIGTAELRTSLLPAPYDAQAQEAIDAYIDLRLESSHTDLTQVVERRALNVRTSALQQRIWDIGVAAADEAPNPVRTGYFLTAVNDMIDAQGSRLDVLNRHVPPAIFYLLFVFFIATGALIGYSTGLGERRSRVPALVLNLLICLMVFIIIDLDRPRRGVIEVRQDSMEALR